MALKNEAERIAVAHRIGRTHGKHMIRNGPPSKLRTQIERDAYAAGHVEGEAEQHREYEEHERAQEEADRNRPPPPPPDDVTKTRSCLLAAVRPRARSIAVGRAVTRGDEPEHGFGPSLIYGGEGQSAGVSFHLTEKQAVLAGELCVAIVKELRQERQRGREDGHNMLARLANGEITVATYEDRR